MGCGASSPQQPRPPASVPSKPVTLPKKWAHAAPITQAELDDMRRVFWDTRVDNDPACWENLKAASEALQNGDPALANAVLEASNITTPTGSLSQAFDPRGAEYSVPRFCCSAPSNLVLGAKGSLGDDASTPIPTTEAENVKSAVRLRVAGGGFGEKDFELTANSNDEISVLKAQLSGLMKTDANADFSCEQMRLFYKGRELRDNVRIATAKLDPGVVVQVYLRK